MTPPLPPFRPIVSPSMRVLVYEDRFDIPSSTRHSQYLYTAHQDTSATEESTRTIVYWPDMSKYKFETR